jgi:CBS domain-containing protein
MLERTIRDLIGEQKLLKMHGEDTVVDAARAMADRRIAAVLVSEGTETYGIVTDHDIVERVVAEGLSPADTLLIHVMTPDPVAIDINHTALDALLLMRDQETRHLLVKEGHKVIGIVSVRDLMRALVAQVLNEHGVGDEMWQGLHA